MANFSGEIASIELQFERIILLWGGISNFVPDMSLASRVSAVLNQIESVIKY
jgi:hypothetical protein